MNLDDGHHPDQDQPLVPQALAYQGDGKRESERERRKTERLGGGEEVGRRFDRIKGQDE